MEPCVAITTAALELPPDAHLVVGDNGTIVDVNEQLVRLFDYPSRDELIGRQLELLVPERYRAIHEEHRERFKHQAAHIRPMGAGLELFGRKRDGTEFPVDIALHSLQDGRGTCAVVRDVTAHKADERRLSEELEARRRVQQEAIDTICHELRAPLLGLFGAFTFLTDCVEKLSHGQPLAPLIVESREHLAVMDQCLQQQRVLVDDVLNMSKLEAQRIELHPEMADIAALLSSLQQIFSVQIKEKNLDFCVQTLNKPLLACVDRVRLQQVLLNLVGNALKFTSTGRIAVIASLARDSELRIRIEDSGIGMTEEELGRLFNRYVQAGAHTAARYGGSGLGLYISKQLVDLMGGKLCINSKKDQGTTVEFSVPTAAVAGAAMPSATSPSLSSRVTSSREPQSAKAPCVVTEKTSL